MKLDRVFLAFLKKDGEEHLLYKKNKDLYIDLNTKEKVTEKDIDLRTLIYFKDSIDWYGKDEFKIIIKKKYKDDRSRLIDIGNLCIVDIKKVSDLERTFLGERRTLCQWKAKHITRTLLEDYFCGYKDIRNGNTYKNEHDYYMSENDIYVETGKDSNVKYLREVYPGMKSMEKRKLLKLQYDVMNNKKIN